MVGSFVMLMMPEMVSNLFRNGERENGLRLGRRESLPQHLPHRHDFRQYFLQALNQMIA